MPRLLPLLALVPCAIVGACAEQSPLLPSLHEPASSASLATGPTAPERPMNGRCTTTFTFLAPAPDQPPNVQRLRVESTCQLAHLGRTTGISEQVVTLSAAGSTITSTTTYTSANGDQLLATFAGTGTLPDVGGALSFQGTETYLGGTGRFEDAWGSAVLRGSASLATQTGSFTTSGGVSY